ncbi:hypothetical protein, partial [Stenotrophomonas maltophilia]|uniref:hypothetical protein n=1 Tax=Stenotrophomonas maltophilia TaxID=40324 RepID=UPI001954C532
VHTHGLISSARVWFDVQVAISNRSFLDDSGDGGVTTRKCDDAAIDILSTDYTSHEIALHFRLGGCPAV